MTWVYNAWLSAVAAFAAFIVVRWRPDDPASCLAAFKANRWIGLAVFAAIVAGGMAASRGPPMTDTISRLDDLIKQAIAGGADAADALLVDSASLSVGRRMRQPERLERSELIDFGLRVFIGKRQATVSSTDLKAETLSGLVDKALQMARVVPEDEFAGIADPEQIAKDWPELDLYDHVPNPAPNC